MDETKDDKTFNKEKALNYLASLMADNMES